MIVNSPVRNRKGRRSLSKVPLLVRISTIVFLSPAPGLDCAFLNDPSSHQPDSTFVLGIR